MNRHMYFRQQEKNYLCHHGIKGQKWGIRRYQNPDGTLTEEGRKRYGFDSQLTRNEIRNIKKQYNRADFSMNPLGRAEDISLNKDNVLSKNTWKIYEDYAITRDKLNSELGNTKPGSKRYLEIEKELNDLRKERDDILHEYIDNALGQYKNDKVGSAKIRPSLLGGVGISSKTTTLGNAVLSGLNEKIITNDLGKNHKSFDQYIKEFDEHSSHGEAKVYNKPKTDSRPQFGFYAKDDFEKEWKAREAKILDEDYDQFKKEWDDAIIKSGIMNKYGISKKDQKALLNSQDSIFIDRDGDEDYAYVGYYKHGINPGNNSLIVDYDLKNIKVKNIAFDS